MDIIFTVVVWALLAWGVGRSLPVLTDRDTPAH
jgi:hypothetical protein